MFKPHYGQCYDCPPETTALVVINKPRLCDYHNRLRKAKGILKDVSTRIKKKFKKKTGELDVFKEIWEEREHKCFVCGSELGEFSVILFSHVLTKGAYPSLRLNKENILLKCEPCHHRYEFQDTSHSMWDKVKAIKKKLKFEYYNPNTK